MSFKNGYCYNGLSHYKFKEFDMKKVLFLSICLLGTSSCFAQDFQHFLFLKILLRSQSMRKHILYAMWKSIISYIKIGNECLYSLSLSLDSAIDKRYKELQIKIKKIN